MRGQDSINLNLAVTQPPAVGQNLPKQYFKIIDWFYQSKFSRNAVTCGGAKFIKIVYLNFKGCALLTKTDLDPRAK